MPGNPILEIHPPVAYSSGLWWVAGGLVLLAVLVPLAGWWFTRPRRVKPVPPAPVVVPVVDARATAMRELAELRRAHAERRIDDRAAHQRTSLVLRTFVAAVSGTKADSLTLAELRSAATNQPWLGNLSQFVEQVYPPNFAIDATRSVEQTFSEAERMVGSWR